MKPELYNKWLYARSFGPLENTFGKREFMWFSQIRCYGSNNSYGKYLHKFKPTSPLKLIPLHTLEQRINLVEDIMKDHKHGNNINYKVAQIAIDPNNQYSGGNANKRLHKLLKQLYSLQYDGTIIADACADETCAGPTEVVVWNLHKIRYVPDSRKMCPS